MKQRLPRDQHLDFRVTEQELTDILRRVPSGISTADWARAQLLGQEMQRPSVVRQKSFRDLTPYRDRLRADALLSIASSLGWIASSPLEPALQHKLDQVLGLVRREILKEVSS